MRDVSSDQDEARRRPWRSAALGLAGLAVASIVAVLIWSIVATTRQRDTALEWRSHSFEVMILARELDATMGQAEATLGRFVISGDKNIGRIYFDGWRRAGTLIDRLDRETRSDARQQAMMAALRDAYATRGRELADVALRTNYGQNAQALSTYYAAGKAPSLAQLEGSVDRMIAVERDMLEARSRAADASVTRSNRFALTLAIVGALVALGALALGWSAWQSWTQKRDEERRNVDLEYAVADRTAELSEANALLVEEMATRASTEERLRQAQKMEAVGQLTGGIAHDFNNMLSVVIGGIELAKRRLSQNVPGAERHLDHAMEGANRAATLTKRLLAFARAEPLLPSATDPDALIGDMVEMLDRTLGDTIEIVLDTTAEWTVFADRHQLENALLNLAVNARDAMANGGTLTIGTGDVALVPGEVNDLPGGDYVRISVRDTGIGMNREVLARIFEPFFTTKGIGKGTGLGLSQIFGFVRQSGGGIAVDSVPGAGTTVALYLPRHMHETVPSTVPLAEAEPRVHGGVVVLVIEDDPRVLNATVAALRELGHDPIPCPTPADVPRLLRARRDIELIVSDVLMPGVTGPQLVAAIHVVQPELPVLFVTGFAGDIDDADAFNGHDVLRKPFTMATLGAAVDRVLDRADARRAEAA